MPKKQYRDLSGEGIVREIRTPGKISSEIVIDFPIRGPFAAHGENKILECAEPNFKSRLCRLGIDFKRTTMQVRKRIVTVVGRVTTCIPGYPPYRKPIKDCLALNIPVGRLFFKDRENQLTENDIIEARESRDLPPEQQIYFPTGSLIYEDRNEGKGKVLVPVEPAVHVFPNKDSRTWEEVQRLLTSPKSSRRGFARITRIKGVDYVELPPGAALVSHIHLRIGEVFAMIDEKCDPPSVRHLSARRIDPWSPYVGHRPVQKGEIQKGSDEPVIHVELENTSKKETASNPYIPLTFYRAVVENGNGK